MVTTVLACVAPWISLLAVIVIDFAAPLVGAVNKPLEEMTPPVADQVTAVLLVLVTAAVNWSFPPATTDGSAGEISTETGFAKTVIAYAFPPPTVGPSCRPATRVDSDCPMTAN